VVVFDRIQVRRVDRPAVFPFQLRGKLSLCKPRLFAGFPEYLTESPHLRSSGTSKRRLLVKGYRTP
jgi:hypothetical protein